MYKRSEQGWLKHLDFIMWDVLCAQLAFIIAYGLRFGFQRWVYEEEIYRNLAIWMALFGVVLAVMFNTMHDVLKRRWTTELRQTLTQSLLVFGVVVIYLFSIKDSEKYSRLVLWMTLTIYAALAYLVRMAWKWFLKRQLRSEQKRAMLLIADERSVKDTIRQFEAHPLENIALCGLVLVNRDGTGERIDGIPVVASLDDAARYICREWIDEVYIGVPDANLTPYDLIDKCRQMGVTLHLQMVQLGSGKQTVEKIAGMPVITNSINIASPIQLIVKRLVDILGGLALSLATGIAIICIGPVIKRKSPGPILYKQERIGQNGKKFKMYKIRSMHMDADARKQELMSQNRVSGDMMFKLDFDPRIIGNEVLPNGARKTGIGEFIRRTSIDELPQGFNVLVGQMSLVGTRPPTVDEWERYELHHRARLATKPGITGMWQVSGRSEITDFEEITRLDMEYIENWSIGLDIRILLKTVGAVLGSKGAM
ncbi:MAG: sugar transferase [Clostridia bacterium]|nr:sugar transferase [Clostridia bacterium]